LFVGDSADNAMKWRVATISEANHASVMLLGSLCYYVCGNERMFGQMNKEIMAVTKVFGFQARLVCLFQITKENVKNKVRCTE
jgi:hypothetical protein